MGNVKKLMFNSRTLDDAIVKDGLEAVTALNGKEPYFLVGGIATQSYLPTRCRRPTADLDFAIARSLSKPEFREMVVPVVGALKDIGYNVSEKISGRSRSYALYVSRPDCCNEDTLCLEFVRRNDENFNKHKTRLEREYAHSRKKIIEGRTSTYQVCSPEDIAVPKLVRTINSLRRSPKFLNYVPRRQTSFSNEEIDERISDINELRAEAMSNPGDPLLAEKLRFVSDIYDIRMLSEITGFNQDYFIEAGHDWHDIRDNPSLREKIFTVALPLFLGVPFR